MAGAKIHFDDFVVSFHCHARSRHAWLSLFSLDRKAMRVSLPLASVLLLGACSATSFVELTTGVHKSDQVEIRAATHALTNSPITSWQLYPDTTKPTEVIFYTKDGKIYSAEKIGGKWHITDITKAIVVLNTTDLTNRWSQRLTGAKIPA